MNRRNALIILSIIVFIVIIGGLSYSYFVYNKNIGDVTLNTGEISINLSDVSNDKTLTGIIPMSDNEGKVSQDYIDFTVDGTVDTERIYYEVYITPDSNSTMDTDSIKVYLTDQNDNEIKGVTFYNSLQSSEKTGKRIYRTVIELNANQTTENYSKDFRLRVWLDENYTETTSKQFDFDINLYAYNVDADFIIPTGENLVKRAIVAKQNATTNSCDPVFIDDNGTANNTSDDITYFSGTNDCVDMNYVWYSGKLWRITAIYPDGAMKLVTQNNITSIAFNETGQVNFYTDANTTSYMYQWLNEDFYDTLYNASQFIDKTKKWDIGTTSDITLKPNESVNISANVGLLNSYEYYNSYRKLESYSNGYLNINYHYWLLNPYSESRVWNQTCTGIGSDAMPTYGYGVRPSIYIKSGFEFTGDGTSSSPYKIVGDKESGTSNELVNTRLSGEYVKLKNGSNEQVFRIIGVEDSKTKIIAMDYADDMATRKYAASNSDTLWGNGTTTAADTWYTYLNTAMTGYFAILKNTYGELFDSGIYQLGESGYNYKNSICSDPVPSEGNDCAIEFNIGLPRYGEMFATQQAGGETNSIDMWLMNRYVVSKVWHVHSSSLSTIDFTAYERGARPTVHLKSTVKILSGSGTETDPYVVGL